MNYQCLNRGVLATFFHVDVEQILQLAYSWYYKCFFEVFLYL